MAQLASLMVFIVNIASTYVCNFTCPKNKSYCSHVGCVFECLEPFYTNGTDCVMDCGHLFVDQNRHCTGTCPAGTVIMETLRLTNADQYLERKCVECSVSEGFIQNNECVKRCPENWKYIEEENHARCIQNCPSNRSFTNIIQRFGVPHSQCVSECLSPLYTNDTNCVVKCGQFVVEQTRNCVETCPSYTFIMGNNCVLCNGFYEYVMNNACVTVCPENWRYTEKGNRKICVQECPSESPFTLLRFLISRPTCVANCSYLIENGMCVNYCSDGKVISGKLCVDYCPESSPYQYQGVCYSACPSSFIKLKSNNFTCVDICPVTRPYILNDNCMESCPELISFNKQCVGKCRENEVVLNSSCLYACPPPTVTFKNTCIEKCPEESNLPCQTRIGNPCGRNPGSDESHTVCVTYCPSNMFVWKNTCLYQCPEGVPSFEQECTEKCPTDRPYQLKYYWTDDFCYNCGYKELVKCTDVCPDNTYMYNDTCFVYCPSSLFQFEKNCVTACPVNASLQANLTVPVVFKQYWREVEIKRVNVIQCVSSCAPPYLQLDATCIEKCPETAPFVHNRTCKHFNCKTKFLEFSENGIICKDSCDGYLLEYNNTCYKKCPRPFMVYNRTCVEKCPDSHRYIAQTTYSNCSWCSLDELRNECFQRCPGVLFTKQNYCVNVCEPPLFTFQTECLSTCPISSPYIDDSTIKVLVWQTFATNIQLSSIQQQIRSCVSVCPSNKVLYNGICTELCPSHARFIKNQTCSIETCDSKLTYLIQPLGIFCIDKCPKNTLEYNQTCIKQCQDNYKVYNYACVPNCPHMAQFEIEKPVDTDLYNCTDINYLGKLCSNALHHVCTNECPVDKYTAGTNCVPQCPDGYFIFNKICNEKCPDSEQLIQPVQINASTWLHVSNSDLFWYNPSTKVDQKKCVNKCYDGFYKFGNLATCVETCKEPLPLSLDGVCVAACPAGTLLDVLQKMCVDTCSNDTVMYNNSCYNSCPEHVGFIYNLMCTEKCPDSAPFALKKDRNTCRKSCEDDKLFIDGDCISKYLCDDPFFEYDGACIERCPTGYVWLVSCSSRQALYVSMVCLAITFILALLCSWQFLWDFFRVVSYITYLQTRLEAIEMQLWCNDLSGLDDHNVETCDGIVLKNRYNFKRKHNKVKDDSTPLLSNANQDTLIDFEDETLF